MSEENKEDKDYVDIKQEDKIENIETLSLNDIDASEANLDEDKSKQENVFFNFVGFGDKIAESLENETTYNRQNGYNRKSDFVKSKSIVFAWKAFSNYLKLEKEEKKRIDKIMTTTGIFIFVFFLILIANFIFTIFYFL